MVMMMMMMIIMIMMMMMVSTMTMIMMSVCTISGHDSLAEADKWKHMYKELEKVDASLGKQLSTSNYDHSVALDRMQEEMMKLRHENEELLMVNTDVDVMRNELRAYQSINNIIIGVMTLISKIRLPPLHSNNSSSSNDRSNSSSNYYISSSSSSSFPSSSSSSSSPLSKLPSSHLYHQQYVSTSPRKSEFDTLLQSIHRMISSTIDMNAIKFSSSSSSPSSSSTIITSTPTSGSIATLLQSLVLFLDDLSSRCTSYQEVINQMTTTNISNVQSLEMKLNSCQDEMMDIGSSVDKFNHQLRESGIVLDINSNSSGSSSSSNSNNSPIRVKVTRFDEGG
jgi:hypothetical protein